MSDIDASVRVLLAEQGIAIAGTNERAVTREVALSCVRLLKGTGTPILGGDVYYVRGTGLEPAYANWHNDRTAGESEAAFLQRSSEAARRYIENFPEHPGKQPVFVLVTPHR